MKNNNDKISKDAWELFKLLYISPVQLSARRCWLDIKHINETENKGWKIPSLNCMYELIEKRIPEKVLVRYREGLAAYRAKYLKKV